MIPNSIYNQIVNEHIDKHDTLSRKTLLALNESEKSEMLIALTGKLYENIVDKVDDIDFGNIPETKGDFTKIDNYEKLVECVDTLDSILIELKQDPYRINVVKDAIANIEARKELFEKAFRLDVELPMVMYTTIALSIVSSVSYLISVCVDFVKLPNDEDFNMTIKKVGSMKNNSKDHLLLSNLHKFNTTCKNGQLDKSMEYVIGQGSNNFTGSGVMASVAIVGLALNIIPIMRELIFFFFYSRTQISDYFEIQSELLQVNAMNIKDDSTIDKRERKMIYDKQMKLVARFRKISDFFAIEVQQSDKKATVEVSKADKKHKAQDMLDKAPDNLPTHASSASSQQSSIF